MTDASENITFPQLLLRAVIIFIYKLFVFEVEAEEMVGLQLLNPLLEMWYYMINLNTGKVETDQFIIIKVKRCIRYIDKTLHIQNEISEHMVQVIQSW